MKGYKGETCAEAIANSIKPEELVSAKELFKRTKSKGAWLDETVWQHLMSSIVNLPPARHHWVSAKAFLLLHENGMYELYDKNRHPRPIE